MEVAEGRTWKSLRRSAETARVSINPDKGVAHVLVTEQCKTYWDGSITLHEVSFDSAPGWPCESSITDYLDHPIPTLEPCDRDRGKETQRCKKLTMKELSDAEKLFGKPSKRPLFLLRSLASSYINGGSNKTSISCHSCLDQ